MLFRSRHRRYGMLAVPVAAAIGVLVRFGLRQYLASPLYKGHPLDKAD